VLTHWKERERVYVQRSERIRGESGGLVPAYAVATLAGEPVETPPEEPRRRRRGRLTTPEEPEEVSREEFDDLVADLDVDDPRAVAPVPQRTPSRSSSVSSTGGARPAPKPKKDKADKPKRPRNRRHGRNR
jgi:hypothetical protein